MTDELVSVRYLVDDVAEAVAFYAGHLGFAVLTDAAPAFCDVKRGARRLLLSGPLSSAGRAMADGEQPSPGGRAVPAGPRLTARRVPSAE
jgi:catechol 2,3-dioxygenase-like lactoylglutathione lyase family enzyme